MAQKSARRGRKNQGFPPCHEHAVGDMVPVHAEVVSKLRERGLSLDEVREALGGLHLDVRPLSQAQAMLIGDLRPATRPLGLSLRDRACLALAIDLEAEIYTTDTALTQAEVAIKATNIRGTQP